MVKITHKTKETDIRIDLKIKGHRNIDVRTGIGFFDHILTSLAFWAGWDMTLTCTGDLNVDTHHIVEDAALTLGKAFNQAWTNNKSFERIAYVICPMDEALSRVVVDICNRPFCVFESNFNVERVGEYETYMTGHFFNSFAQEARITLHIHSLFGENAHHIIESMFKGLGLALRRALAPRKGSIASTKGTL